MNKQTCSVWLIISFHFARKGQTTIPEVPEDGLDTPVTAILNMKLAKKLAETQYKKAVNSFREKRKKEKEAQDKAETETRAQRLRGISPTFGDSLRSQRTSIL